MTVDFFVNKIVEEGIELSDEQRGQVVSQIEDALKNNRLVLLKDTIGRNIGFLTYTLKDVGNKSRVSVKNCLIYKQYRGKNSLIYLRKIFRNITNNIDCFYWKSRKRGRLCYVR